MDVGGRQEVDAIAARRGHLAPGEFVRFTPQQARLSEAPRGFSLHHAGLADVLTLARALDRPLPSIVVFGVQPRDIGWGEGLSPDIEANLPTLVDAVLEEATRRVTDGANLSSDERRHSLALDCAKPCRSSM
jgi:hydrogenase maturation protease